MASIFPCSLITGSKSFSCESPFLFSLGSDTMIFIWITHFPVYMVLNSLSIKVPCFLVADGKTCNPHWASLFSLGNLDLGQITVASSQQLDPKAKVHSFLLTSPRELPGPYPFQVLITHFPPSYELHCNPSTVNCQG